MFDHFSHSAEITANDRFTETEGLYYYGRLVFIPYGRDYGHINVVVETFLVPIENLQRRPKVRKGLFKCFHGLLIRKATNNQGVPKMPVKSLHENIQAFLSNCSITQIAKTIKI